jgi:hypothetical protein
MSTDSDSDMHNPVFARLHHRLLSKEGQRMRALPTQVLVGSSGRILEVGPGNGPNVMRASPSEPPRPYIFGIAR